jgi:predicted amidohydrolase
MRLSYFQTDIHHGFPERNLDDLSTALEQQADLGATLGEVLVLPELFTTGYIFENASLLRPLAEPVPEGKSTQRLIALAERYDTTIVAGVPELHEGEIYNSAVVVGRDGLLLVYRKQKLSVIDRRYFAAGKGNGIFQVGGVKIGILVCFDIWFPELARRYLTEQVDLVLHLANFGGPQTLDIARSRALENSLPILTCNRLGNERLTIESGERRHTVTATYRGESQLIDYDGTVVYRSDAAPDLATVEIDIDPDRRKQVLGNDLMSLLDL